MESPAHTYMMMALAAVGIFTVYMALVAIFRRGSLRDRMLVTASAGEAVISGPDEKTPLASFCETLLVALGVNLNNARKTLALPLGRAGIYSSNAVIYFMFIRLFIQPLLVIASALVLLQLLALDHPPPMIKALYGILIAMLFICGAWGTSLYLGNCRQKRQQILIRSFPDALDLLLVCIESGLALDGALARVCRELKYAHPEVAEEFDRTRIDLAVLGDRVQALQNLAVRTDILPCKALVASLVQTEKFGTSLAETLRVLSEDYRITRLMNAENKASRLPALITVPLILFFLPAFVMIIIGPAFVRVQQQGGLFGPSVSGR
jgi:tight adherence protein C